MPNNRLSPVVVEEWVVISYTIGDLLTARRFSVLNQNSILNVFAKSPIAPLKRHMETVHLCTEALTPFMQACLANDFTQASELYEKISENERAADHLKQQLRSQLPRSIFLPVPRSDVLDLLSTQDVLANKAKDIAGIMLGRKMVFPKELADSFLRYVSFNVAASAKAKTTIDQLEELLESGFRGKETDLVERMVQEIDELERQSDQEQIKLRHTLFAIEDSMSPVSVIFFYKIIQWVGEIADAAQSVGHRLLLLSSS